MDQLGCERIPVRMGPWRPWSRKDDSVYYYYYVGNHEDEAAPLLDGFWSAFAGKHRLCQPPYTSTLNKAVRQVLRICCK